MRARKRAPRNAFERADVFEKLDRREMRIDAEVLREVSERSTQRIGRRGDVASVEPDRPAGGFGDGGQHAHQRGLSGSIRAQQPEDSGLEPQCEIADGMDGPVALIQSLDLEFHPRIYA